MISDINRQNRYRDRDVDDAGATDGGFPAKMMAHTWTPARPSSRSTIHHRAYQRLSAWLLLLGAMLLFAQVPMLVRGDAAECPAGGYLLGRMQALRPRNANSTTFGTAVDLTPDGKWLLVGDAYQGALDGGSAVLYENKAAGWQFVKQFSLLEPAADKKDLFGTGVVINDDATILAITHTRQANSAPYTGAIPVSYTHLTLPTNREV